MMEAYWSGFNGIDGLRVDFDAAAIQDFPSDADILFAAYDSRNYEGDATVLFRRGADLFMVTASHCSCYGLEGQWVPSPVMIAELSSSTNSFWSNMEDKAAWSAMVADLGGK